MIGIRLTKDAEGRIDMVMEDGVLLMAEDGIAAASDNLSGMLTFRDECLASPIIDTVQEPEAGVDYYGVVLDTSKSRAEKELELKRGIMAIRGNKKILRFAWGQDAHKLTYSYDVQTLWGAESVSQEVTPL